MEAGGGSGPCVAGAVRAAGLTVCRVPTRHLLNVTWEHRDFSFNEGGYLVRPTMVVISLNQHRLWEMVGARGPGTGQDPPKTHTGLSHASPTADTRALLVLSLPNGGPADPPALAHAPGFVPAVFHPTDAFSPPMSLPMHPEVPGTSQPLGPHPAEVPRCSASPALPCPVLLAVQTLRPKTSFLRVFFFPV